MGVSLAFSDSDSPAAIAIQTLNQVVGAAVWPLMFALIRSRTPSQQLELLSQLAQQLTFRVGALVAPSFRVNQTGCGCFHPNSRFGAPGFRPGTAVYTARRSQDTPVTVKDALVSHYSALLKEERWRALSKKPARYPHPYTDAFVQKAKRPASPQEAAMLLGMMEDASLHSWTDVCDRDLADYSVTAADKGCCFGICEAVRMCQDKSAPFQDIKIAWLTCREKASMKRATEQCARIRAVRQTLQDTSAQAVAAELSRRRSRVQSNASSGADWREDSKEFFAFAFDSD
eukprot:1692822-Rhodomonas_salina.1